MVILLCVSLFVIAYLFGFSGLHNNKKPKDDKIKIACVGDSVTYGHGVANWPTNNYPAQLQRLLGDKYHVSNFGVSGSTAQNDSDKPYMETKAYQHSLSFNADIVVIMLGTNDTKTHNWEDLQAFLKDYNILINSYKQNNTNVKIFVCSPVKAFFVKENQFNGASSFDIQPKIVEQIANSIQSFCAENDYYYIDMYSNIASKEMFSRDGIHPNKEGALYIAHIVAQSIIM